MIRSQIFNNANVVPKETNTQYGMEERVWRREARQEGVDVGLGGILGLVSDCNLSMGERASVWLGILLWCKLPLRPSKDYGS